MTNEHDGGCLCRGVRYRHGGPMREVVACHCGQCRRTSGHFVAATEGAMEQFSLTADATLEWCESSAGVFRGFCNRCGSSLFWRREGSGRISIMAGTLDRPTGLRLTAQIHVADRGDHYRLDPDLPSAEAGTSRQEFQAERSRQQEEP